MKTIAQRYKLAHQTMPNVGSYLVLSKSVRGMKFGKQNINTHFNKYVPKSDYAGDEKDVLLENLYRITEEYPPDFLPLSFEPTLSPITPLTLAIPKLKIAHR